jgi:hypothetical protein
MSSRCPPLIMVMQPTHLWDFPDRANLWPLNRPRYRTIHVQCPVRSPGMIVREVADQKPPQKALLQDDRVVQAFAADTSDQPLDIRILPRTSGGDDKFFDECTRNEFRGKVARDGGLWVQGTLRPW